MGRVADVLIDERDAVSYVGVKDGLLRNELHPGAGRDRQGQRPTAPDRGRRGRRDDQTRAPLRPRRDRLARTGRQGPYVLRPRTPPDTDARRNIPSRRRDPLRFRRQGGHRPGREGGGLGSHLPAQLPAARAADEPVDTGSEDRWRSRDQRGWRRLPPQEDVERDEKPAPNHLTAGSASRRTRVEPTAGAGRGPSRQRGSSSSRSEATTTAPGGALCVFEHVQRVCLDRP